MSFPPIFVMLDQSGEALRMFHTEEVAVLNASRNAGSAVVRYEPAVPMYATYPKFVPPYAPGIDGGCLRNGLQFEAPADGSGYCWRHPEAKR